MVENNAYCSKCGRVMRLVMRRVGGRIATHRECDPCSITTERPSAEPTGNLQAGHDPICRLCGQPIRDGAPRYLEPEGDAHAECRDKARRPRTTDIDISSPPPSYAPPPGTPVAGP
jgi:hypothetical protein